MPTVTAQSIIDKAETILQDTTNVRWPVAELLGWLNDGQREVCILRPDASTKTLSVTLSAGTRQALPADGTMLVKVVRNMGTNGTTPGQAIRKVPHELLDSQTPNWHTATAAATTLHYTYDPRTPRIYYVYPPATGTSQVEIAYGCAPDAVAAVGNTITIDDVYANALLDYVLYRAYSKDMELTGNAERAMAARTAFEQSLGLKAQSDAAAVPKDAVRG